MWEVILVWGMFIFGILVGSSMYIDTAESYEELKPLIEQCEKDLPRTQTCVLIAVPKKD